ncbi:GL10368 [Drosophila persimilis]|uniref:GL10368 n=1 Tax=Drosophila persimilis TaxID=7234 RepID=B4GD80_DROPE|nr:GL10368 [Drosophila persimilis]
MTLVATGRALICAPLPGPQSKDVKVTVCSAPPSINLPHKLSQRQSSTTMAIAIGIGRPKSSASIGPESNNAAACKDKGNPNSGVPEAAANTKLNFDTNRLSAVCKHDICCTRIRQGAPAKLPEKIGMLLLHGWDRFFGQHKS